MRPHRQALFAASLGLLTVQAVPAQADGNVLSILQEGTNNTLTIDQSLASASAVNGLKLTRESMSFTEDDGGDGSPRHPHHRHGRHHKFGLLLSHHWSNHGQGSFNPLQLLGNLLARLGHHGPHHNLIEICDPVETVTIDRLMATQDPSLPALQQGNGHTASITIAGNGAQVGLLQSNAPTGSGHTATITALGAATALVGQLGDSNSAILSVDRGSGSILQEGLGNEASLSVGNGSSGLVSQIGNANTTSLDVPAGGANVSYLVYGNGLNGSVPASVVSNAVGTVVIRQYQSGLSGYPGTGS